MIEKLKFRMQVALNHILRSKLKNKFVRYLVWYVYVRLAFNVRIIRKSLELK